MKELSSKELSVAYFVDNGIKSKSLSDSKITDIIKRSNLEVTNVSVDVVRENLVKTLDSLLDVFECEQLDGRKFYTDEIEIALNVGYEGTVSILSAVSGQANVQSSIVVKLKRRAEKNEC